MSLTITRPPPPQIATAQESQRVYTLHSGPNKIFAWRLDNERVKTATVVFKRQEDALFMAHMIEKHVTREKEWPEVSVMDNIFKLYGNDPAEVENNIIDIKTWDFDSLCIFCVRSYLDIVTLNSLTKQNDGFKLTGDVISLSVPIEFYVDRVRSMYEG